VTEGQLKSRWGLGSNEKYLPLFALVEDAKVAYGDGWYWNRRYEFIGNTTFCRDRAVVDG